jgi:hypothetical protein
MIQSPSSLFPSISLHRTQHPSLSITSLSVHLSIHHYLHPTLSISLHCTLHLTLFVQLSINLFHPTLYRSLHLAFFIHLSPSHFTSNSLNPPLSIHLSLLPTLHCTLHQTLFIDLSPSNSLHRSLNLSLHPPLSATLLISLHRTPPVIGCIYLYDIRIRYNIFQCNSSR